MNYFISLKDYFQNCQFNFIAMLSSFLGILGNDNFFETFKVLFFFPKLPNSLVLNTILYFSTRDEIDDVSFFIGRRMGKHSATLLDVWDAREGSEREDDELLYLCSEVFHIYRRKFSVLGLQNNLTLPNNDVCGSQVGNVSFFLST